MCKRNMMFFPNILPQLCNPTQAYRIQLADWSAQSFQSFVAIPLVGRRCGLKRC